MEVRRWNLIMVWLECQLGCARGWNGEAEHRAQVVGLAILRECLHMDGARVLGRSRRVPTNQEQRGQWGAGTRIRQDERMAKISSLVRRGGKPSREGGGSPEM